MRKSESQKHLLVYCGNKLISCDYVKPDKAIDAAFILAKEFEAVSVRADSPKQIQPQEIQNEINSNVQSLQDESLKFNFPTLPLGIVRPRSPFYLEFKQHGFHEVPALSNEEHVISRNQVTVFDSLPSAAEEVPQHDMERLAQEGRSRMELIVKEKKHLQAMWERQCQSLNIPNMNQIDLERGGHQKQELSPEYSFPLRDQFVGKLVSKEEQLRLREMKNSRQDEAEGLRANHLLHKKIFSYDGTENVQRARNPQKAQQPGSSVKVSANEKKISNPALQEEMLLSLQHNDNSSNASEKQSISQDSVRIQQEAAFAHQEDAITHIKSVPQKTSISYKEQVHALEQEVTSHKKLAAAHQKAANSKQKAIAAIREAHKESRKAHYLYKSLYQYHQNQQEHDSKLEQPTQKDKSLSFPQDQTLKPDAEELQEVKNREKEGFAAQEKSSANSRSEAQKSNSKINQDLQEGCSFLPEISQAMEKPSIVQLHQDPSKSPLFLQQQIASNLEIEQPGFCHMNERNFPEASHLIIQSAKQVLNFLPILSRPAKVQLQNQSSQNNCNKLRNEQAKRKKISVHVSSKPSKREKQDQKKVKGQIQQNQNSKVQRAEIQLPQIPGVPIKKNQLEKTEIVESWISKMRKAYLGSRMSAEENKYALHKVRPQPGTYQRGKGPADNSEVKSKHREVSSQKKVVKKPKTIKKKEEFKV